ncbi:hypothetical protein [Pseudomonas aeruginosa]|uniref:hypothetical protein n=1 Tax=Pseudomonas aeruginosa TaxID=287 RepID=UPI0021E75347|nr:hypothetical protein [Pseudomonas aeruginosa]MCV3851715.1 hypothetical protein [Pseudomonas aeruginosa]MCV3857746.1 hypothetical protein [Pseudomonas aeruginosa]HCF6753924.1 hypothetical protein [Pseudomonas aeruginosa]
MTDINKLRELAQRAIGFDMKNDWMFKPVISYLAAANPAAVLDLIAEVEALRGALHAVQAEVDGNLRPLTRDLVNMVSGLNNGTHPNDIYDHCDEIERIIGAALEGAKP